MTVAAFMELALYHPEHGYYTARAQRSGRAGDFYTSVDVGPLYGELLALAVARLGRALLAVSPESPSRDIDLVEAAAGNGRLMGDVLDGLQRDAPDVYAGVRVHLVERSAKARAEHRDVLGPHAERLRSSSAELPSLVDGIVFANELLDALPVHVVVMRGETPREIFVDVEHDRLVERELPVSSDRVREAIESGPPVPDGVRIEIGAAAEDWMARIAARLARGFLVLIDYGDDAQALRSTTRPDGTLRAFSAHRVSGRWLEAPGEQDLTAHVDFTAVTRAAAEGGLELLQRVEQSRFLIGLGAIEHLQERDAALPSVAALRRRLALKTLLVPGGMGSTHHVLVFRERGLTPFFQFS
jgi:SAM-dependent MidA family methyltransferase